MQNIGSLLVAMIDMDQGFVQIRIASKVFEHHVLFTRLSFGQEKTRERVRCLHSFRLRLSVHFPQVKTYSCVYIRCPQIYPEFNVSRSSDCCEMTIIHLLRIIEQVDLISVF